MQAAGLLNGPSNVVQKVMRKSKLSIGGPPYSKNGSGKDPEAAKSRSFLSLFSFHAAHRKLADKGSSKMSRTRQGKVRDLGESKVTDAVMPARVLLLIERAGRLLQRTGHWRVRGTGGRGSMR